MSATATASTLSFSDRIRQTIRESGWTRYRLARASGGRLHESELSRFFSGRGNLGLPKLDIIAELIGMHVEFDPAAKQCPSPMSEELAEVGANAQLLEDENQRLRAFAERVCSACNWQDIISAVNDLDNCDPSKIAADCPPLVTKPLDDSTGADGPAQS